VRVYVTGASGFVGSNIVSVALDEGHEVKATGHSWVPTPECAHWDYESVDLADESALATSIARFGPDLVVHSAIWNDPVGCLADRPRAWDAYVGATGRVVDAARAVDAHAVVVSTDWVFDGTQAGADETTPPNPVNFYGVLKTASELVATERGGAVARVTSSPIEELVMTDSIQATEAVRVAQNIRQLTIAPLLGEAMRRISDEQSVSSLFD